MTRIFFAIKCSEQVEQLLKDHQKTYENIEGIKIEDSLHCTIKFVGEVPDEKVEKIKQYFKEFKFWKFQIKIKKTQVFPSIIKPNHIVASIEHSDHLQNLKKVFEEYMFKFFEKDERQFRPHINLIRNKAMVSYEIVNLQKKNEIIFDKEIEISEMVLIKSTLTKQGPIHEEIEKVKFN